MRNCSAVGEQRLGCGSDRPLKFGRRYSPTLLPICRSTADQVARDVIAVATLAVGRPLHIQRLTPLVEYLARERTGRCLSLATATTLTPRLPLR
jgi:hypothetical protein